MTLNTSPAGEAVGDAWNRLRYAALAPVYDAARVFAPARRRSFKLLALRPGERVLVVGCGTGLDFPYLLPGVHLTAEGLMPAMVRHARGGADALGLTAADVRVLDAHRLDELRVREPAPIWQDRRFAVRAALRSRCLRAASA